MKNFCYEGRISKKGAYGVIQKNYLKWGGMPKRGEGVGSQKRGIFEREENIKKNNIKIFQILKIIY